MVAMSSLDASLGRAPLADRTPLRRVRLWAWLVIVLYVGLWFGMGPAGDPRHVGRALVDVIYAPFLLWTTFAAIATMVVTGVATVLRLPNAPFGDARFRDLGATALKKSRRSELLRVLAWCVGLYGAIALAYLNFRVGAQSNDLLVLGGIVAAVFTFYRMGVHATRHSQLIVLAALSKARTGGVADA